MDKTLKDIIEKEAREGKEETIEQKEEQTKGNINLKQQSIKEPWKELIEAFCYWGYQERPLIAILIDQLN